MDTRRDARGHPSFDAQRPIDVVGLNYRVTLTKGDAVAIEHVNELAKILSARLSRSIL